MVRRNLGETGLALSSHSQMFVDIEPWLPFTPYPAVTSEEVISQSDHLKATLADIFL